ncbi:hypothetical protein PM8797T_02674 [Gimesia maris DSM 8797]|nr:hypothetical protein PM8797T_02674 [Gimesia maris DSM 8797]
MKSLLKLQLHSDQIHTGHSDRNVIFQINGLSLLPTNLLNCRE